MDDKSIILEKYSHDPTYQGLIKELFKTYPKATWFELQPIIDFMDKAYCIGQDNIIATRNAPRRKVIRSDGKEYDSLKRAAKENKVHRNSIYDAIKKGHKSAGYKWSYAA